MAGTVTVPVVVRNANRPPALADIPAQTVQKGQVLELPIAASDADGNPITLSFDGLPRFPTFVPNVGDSGSGVLRFAPGERDRGDYVIRVTARDDGDGARGVLATTRTFVLSAQSASEPPLFAPIGDKVALIANELQFTLQASDLDQDALRFVADALPPGATLTSGISYGTEVFRWTPGAGDAGARDIAFSVTDSAGQHDTQTIRIVVRATNAPPILLPVGDRTVAEGQALVVQFAALDADGDMLSYSARGSAAGRELRRGDRHAALADQPVLAAGSYYRLDDGAAYNPAAIDGEPAQYTLVDGAGTRYAISVALDSLTGLSLMRLSQVFLRSDLGLVAP